MQRIIYVYDYILDGFSFPLLMYSQPIPENILNFFLDYPPQADSNLIGQFGKLKHLYRYLCDSDSGENEALPGYNEDSTNKWTSLIDHLVPLTSETENNSSLYARAIQHIILLILNHLCDEKSLRAYFARKWLSFVLKRIDLLVEIDERESPAAPIDYKSRKWSRDQYYNARACGVILRNIAKFGDVNMYFTDLSGLARCIRYSSDMYLQLLCGQVLYHIYRTNTDAFDNSVVSILGSNIIDSITQFQPSPRLLSDLCELIQRIPSKPTSTFRKNNSSLCVMEISEVILPPIVFSEAVSADSHLCFHHTSVDGSIMKALFGKTMVVLDCTYEPDLTIPYTAIKTIKMNRNKQLVLRLREVPFTFYPIYEELSQNLERSGYPSKDIVRLADANGFPLQLSAINFPYIREWSDRNIEPRIIPEIILKTTQEEYKKLRECNIHKWIASEIVASKKAESLKGLQASVELRQCSSENRLLDVPDFGNDIQQMGPHQDDRHLVSPSVFIIQEDSCEGSSCPIPISIECSNKSNIFWEPHPTKVPIATVSESPPRSLKIPSYDDEIDPLLEQLRSVITQKVNMRYQQGQKIIAEAQNEIDAEIRNSRKKSAEIFSRFEFAVQDRVATIHAVQQQAQSKMSALIDAFNSDIRAIAEESKIHHDQLTIISLEGTQNVNEMRRTKDSQIKVINQSVESSFQAFKDKIYASFSSANPLRFMTQCLSQSSE